MRLFEPLLRLLILPLVAIAGIPVQAAPAPAAIRVVLDDNYPPYIFRNSSGEVQGILKDLWVVWQQRTGVAVDFQPMDWGRARAVMESGQADVIDTIFETDERRKIYDFSRPYATIEVPIFFDQSIGGITNAASLKGFTVGVKDGDACVDYLKAQNITDLRRYASYEAQVKAAIRREIRVLCIDKPPAFYFFNREGAADEFRYSPPLYVGQFHWAVAKGRTDLKQLVEEGFSRITAEERAAIEARWMGEKLAGGLWPGVARYGVYALIAAALLMVTLFIWNWALRRRVGTRTHELTATVRSLRESEARFRTLFEQANDAIFIMRGPTVLDCNRRAEILRGVSRDQIIGTTPLSSSSPPKQPDGRNSEEILSEMLTKAAAGNAVVFEWRNLRADGSPLDMEISLSCVDFGGETCLQAIVRDITERKQAQEEIQQLAYFDSLTNLPNRRQLRDRLRQSLSVCSRRQSRGAVLFIDLDNFKTLNDTRGHEIGDRLLLEVSRRLRNDVRAEDLIARLGGDEFVVILEDLQASPREAASQAEAVASKILEALGQPFLLGTLEHHTTASIGLCLISGTPDETVDEVLKRADAAMYRAKTAGRNTLRFFDPAMQASIEMRALMEGELRRALPQQQFQLLFQPQVDRDHRVVGAEALLRWQHPQRGVILPGQFISLAEETGLIVPIGQWVLETACLQLRAWNAIYGRENLRVAVNVSARQFRQAAFVASVSDVVRDTGISPGNLTLELTESLVLENVIDSIEKMQALKALGIRFSMDDFGTGYSSLSYLKRLPLDELKIDRSFVRDLAADAGDEVIVRTIIAMAQSLGLRVVAEGVETKAQHELLLKHACDDFQGYLFGYPQPAAKFEQWFGDGARTPPASAGL